MLYLSTGYRQKKQKQSAILCISIVLLNWNSSKNNNFVVAGGVAANKEIRKLINKVCYEENFKSYFPKIDKRERDNLLKNWDYYVNKTLT